MSSYGCSLCSWDANQGCGLADNDFQAAFDFLCFDWVKMLLKKRDWQMKSWQDSPTSLHKVLKFQSLIMCWGHTLRIEDLASGKVTTQVGSGSDME